MQRQRIKKFYGTLNIVYLINKLQEKIWRVKWFKRHIIWRIHHSNKYAWTFFGSWIEQIIKKINENTRHLDVRHFMMLKNHCYTLRYKNSILVIFKNSVPFRDKNWIIYWWITWSSGISFQINLRWMKKEGEVTNEIRLTLDTITKSGWWASRALLSSSYPFLPIQHST